MLIKNVKKTNIICTGGLRVKGKTHSIWHYLRADFASPLTFVVRTFLVVHTHPYASGLCTLLKGHTKKKTFYIIDIDNQCCY